MTSVEEKRLKLLETLAEKYYGTMLVIDRDRRIVYVNKNLLNYFSLKPEDIIGQTMDEMLRKGVFSVSSSLEALRTKQLVYLYSRHKGREPLMAVSIPSLTPEGEVELVISYTLYEPFIESVITNIEKDKLKNLQLIDYLQHTSKSESEIIGKSEKIRSIISFALKIASSESAIVLYGESGTGKEVFAKLIHTNSLRSSQVFLPINCASIPENLIESEFFGYEKGAFTGANRDGKMGFFELANRGTLFLDEIGEMPLSMQSKLLRVLESGEIMRVGGNKPRVVDVRVIAATNRNLQKMAENNQFRWDLYFRLNVLTIIIPPVRERPEDIEALMDFFLVKYNKKHGTRKFFAQDVKDYFMVYSWPGNVREISNMVERLIITSVTDEVSLDLHMGNAYGYGAHVRPAEPEMLTLDTDFPLKDALHKFEQIYIKKKLEKCGDHVNEAAKKLGISRSGLYQKLKAFGIYE